MGIRNHNHHNSQFRRRPLTAAEFVPPLSKIDPIYKEEEDTYRVSVYSVRCAVTMHACCIQGWVGKKRLKAGDDDKQQRGTVDERESGESGGGNKSCCINAWLV